MTAPEKRKKKRNERKERLKPLISSNKGKETLETKREHRQPKHRKPNDRIKERKKHNEWSGYTERHESLRRTRSMFK